MANFLRASRSFTIAMMLGLVSVSSAFALPIVQNGDFSQTTAGPGTPSSTTDGRVGYNVNVTYWNVNTYGAGPDQYDYIDLFDSAATANSNTAIENGPTGNSFELWNANNGGADAITASPAGGAFLAFDGSAEQGPIWQDLSGLTVGQQYAVSFYYAGAEQETFSATTTEGFEVNLQDGTGTPQYTNNGPYGNPAIDNAPSFTAGTTQTTPILTNQPKSFTGWQEETMYFTADNANEILSFLAVGTPEGLPPFVLLNDVQMTAVPEISTVSASLPIAVLSGLMMILVDRRKRQPREAALPNQSLDA